MRPTISGNRVMLPTTDLSRLMDSLSHCADLDEAMFHIDAAIRAGIEHAVVSVNLNATEMGDPANEVQLQRVWTSHPAQYPVTGRKRKKLTHWTETLFVQGRVFVGEGREAVARTFDDHALMAQLNLNAFINVPIARDGRYIGTFNVFGLRPSWSEDEVTTVRLLALLASHWIKPFPALASRITDTPVRIAESPVPALGR
jgi:GAF domain-containing protein